MDKSSLLGKKERLHCKILRALKKKKQPDKALLNGRTSYYQSAEMHHSLREKSLGQFYRFQRHIAGGDTLVVQALNNTRHVHIILQELDSHGTGLDCLARDKFFDIWDKWASPRLRKKNPQRNHHQALIPFLGELFQVGQGV